MTYTLGLSAGFGPIAFDGSKIAYNSGGGLYTWSPGNFHATPLGVNMIPTDMNNAGTIVGISNGIAHSTSGGSLGTLGGTGSEARGVNDAGVVVGWSSLPNGQQRGFIYKNTKMHNLSLLVDFAAVGYVERAYDINNNGWILVSGPLGYALLKPR